MSDEPQVQEIQEVRVDVANLYREEVYTDLRVATIRVLVPVRLDGTPDPSRETLFSGQTTLLSQAGPLPVECAIEWESRLHKGRLLSPSSTRGHDGAVSSARVARLSRARSATRCVGRSARIADFAVM